MDVSVNPQEGYSIPSVQLGENMDRISMDMIKRSFQIPDTTDVHDVMDTVMTVLDSYDGQLYWMKAEVMSAGCEVITCERLGDGIAEGSSPEVFIGMCDTGCNMVQGKMAGNITTIIRGKGAAYLCDVM